MTGQAKISPKISAYYSKPSNQEKIAHTIHQNLLPLMSDCNMAIQDIYTLFIQDDSISDAKKKNLTSLYKPANSRLLFLARPGSLHITCYPSYLILSTSVSFFRLLLKTQESTICNRPTKKIIIKIGTIGT
jgi:hypothetical protein